MKLPALIFTALLGTVTLAPAQSSIPDKPTPTKKPIAASTKDPAKDPKASADGSVFLAADSLVSVIADIERRIPTWPQKSDQGEWVMPNILYGKDAAEAAVPGALTLRGVSPLQAATLAAAAAGCTLDPITAVREETDFQNNPPAIIGYRVVLDKKQNAGTGNFFGQSTSQTTPGQVNAAKTAQDATMQALNAERLKADQARKTEVTLLDSGGILTYQKPATGLTPSNVPAAADPFASPVVKAPDANLRSVRVYALGSILNGSKEEVEEKVKHLQDLVSVAMQKSEPDAAAASTGAPGSAANNRAPEAATVAAPELAFHLELRALVVKGTAAQHEVIEQVMKALKENEKPWWPQPTPPAPLTTPAGR